MEYTGKLVCIKDCFELPSGTKIYTKGKEYYWCDGDSIIDDIGELRTWSYIGEVDKQFHIFFKKVTN